MKELIVRCIFRLFAQVLKLILMVLSVAIVFRGGAAVGDHLCMTRTCYEIAKSQRRKIIVFTPYRDFYEGADWIVKIIDTNFHWWRTLRRALNHLAQYDSGVFRADIQSGNSSYEELMLELEARPDISLNLSALQTFSALMTPFYGVHQYQPILPNEFLKKSEASLMPIGIGYILICVTDKTRYTPNKSLGISIWRLLILKLIERLDARIVVLNPDCLELKLRLSSLKKVHCVNGRKPLPALGRFVSDSAFVIASEGFFVHLAAAYNKTCHVLMSGFSSGFFLNYENVMLHRSTLELPCNPCWKTSSCPIGKVCVDESLIDEVLASLREDV